jgi:hypothetical protein
VSRRVVLVLRFATVVHCQEGTYGEGSLERDVVLSDTLNGIIGDRGLSVLQDRGDIDGLPLDGRLKQT